MKQARVQPPHLVSYLSNNRLDLQYSHYVFKTISERQCDRKSLSTGMHSLQSPHAEDHRTGQPTQRAITVVKPCPDPIKTRPTHTRPPAT